MSIANSARRVLICDDTPKQYNKMKRYFEGEGFESSPQVSSLEGAHAALTQSHRDRAWFSLVVIDLDLSNSAETWNGVQLYEALRSDFPDESYVIYTRSPTDRFRNEINRLAFRDVELVLLDDLLTARKVSLALARVVRAVPPDHVFLVSGRNTVKNRRIEKLLTDGFGLKVVNFELARERVSRTADYIFEIVLAGIEMSHATVVLFTDDELASLKPSLRVKGEPLKVARARPNVYIEAGYAIGLRPKRTVFVEWPDEVEMFEGPSDFQGIHVLRFDDKEDGRTKLLRRLEAARCLLQAAPNYRRMRL